MTSVAFLKTTRAHVCILIALVLLVRLPFVNQAIAGDDVYYLAAAYHALIDPLHPNHTHYVFQGVDVTFEGYPHPPGNAWFLAGLLAIFGDVHEIPFHAVYILFTLVAVFAMYALARRFSCAPFWAAVLFLLVPAFFVNGNSFESDVPLLACWTAAAAAFIYGVDRNRIDLLAVSAVFLAASAMVAMQSFAFTFILTAYLLTRRTKDLVTSRRHAILVALVPILTLVAWQIFERLTTGHFPAQVSTNYMASYGLERIALKIRSATVLTIHSCFIVFPILLPFVIGDAWRRRRDPDTRFLIFWIAIFLLLAWGLFFAGSARYLLPMAAPVVLLASRGPIRWVRIACVAQLVISGALAIVNYQHWNAYRDFARSLQSETEHKRVWVAGEWALRHYFEANGALPLHRDQLVQPGDLIIENDLLNSFEVSHGGSTLVQVAQTEIRPSLPLRIIGLESNSAFSNAGAGLLPFDFRGGLIDRIHAYEVIQKNPTLTVLPMNAPEADSQIVSGIFAPDAGPWRWMSAKAILLLKNPGMPSRLDVKLYIADNAPARSLSFGIQGQEKVEILPGPGSFTLSMPVTLSGNDPVTVIIKVDKTFIVPGDSRALGVILNEVALH